MPMTIVLSGESLTQVNGGIFQRCLEKSCACFLMQGYDHGGTIDRINLAELESRKHDAQSEERRRSSEIHVWGGKVEVQL